MIRGIPLGEPESQTLEFKGAGALKDLASISREVVAMLNSRGGDVWIGIEEREGRGASVEGIPDAEREARRLRDHLVDSIHPSPSAEEVSLSCASDETGRSVLLVRARPRKERKPYAFRKEGGWHFLLRVGDRVRPMSREEFLGPVSSTEEARRTGERLRKEREALREGKAGVYWVRIQPLAPARVPKREDWLDA
ncbi:MAG: AlbA family DNA-binding domain-containing protein, partial [Planctomycetota bacterium]